MKIAITGPSGQIGSKLVEKLLEREDVQLVLLARNAEKLQQVQMMGASVIEGDLNDGAYIRKATEGADALFFLIPPHIAAKNVRSYYNRITDHVVCAVGTNTIPRVVLLSAIGAHLTERTGPILGLRDAELSLMQSDAHLTCLRAGYFMENFLTAVGSIQQANAIYLPVSGSAKTSFIATRDIAAAAATVLADPAWSGKRVIELHGPADLSFDEVAANISEAIGRVVKHVQVTAEQAVEAMCDMGLGKDYAEQLAELHRSIDEGRLKPEQGRSADIAPSTTFAQFAREILAPALLS
ncbi:MAG: NAD(P)H-binding protein [Nitrospiria bacterium]